MCQPVLQMTRGDSQPRVDIIFSSVDFHSSTNSAEAGEQACDPLLMFCQALLQAEVFEAKL